MGYSDHDLRISHGLLHMQYTVLLLRSKNGDECRVAFLLGHYTQPVTESPPVLDHTGTEDIIILIGHSKILDFMSPQGLHCLWLHDGLWRS